MRNRVDFAELRRSLHAQKIRNERERGDMTVCCAMYFLMGGICSAMIFILAEVLK